MPKLKTNEKNLVKIAVQGKIAAAYQWAPFEVAHDGRPFALPSTGGITYNVKVGDPAGGWGGRPRRAGSLGRLGRGEEVLEAEQRLQLPRLLREQRARRLGRGKRGTRNGDRPPRRRRARHHRLRWPGFGPDDPGRQDPDRGVRPRDQARRLPGRDDLLDRSGSPWGKIGLKPSRGGGLRVPVTTIVPAEVMGSGIGALNVGTGTTTS